MKSRYALTAVSVPPLAVAPFTGGAGLALASAPLLLERTGKAIRSPAKTGLLAGATATVGRGTGFGVHKTLDQLGAFLGPLLVAAVSAAQGAYWPAFPWLIIPAAVAMLTPFWLRTRVPNTSVLRPHPTQNALTFVDDESRGGETLTMFTLFAVFAALTTFSLVGFGVITVHLEDAGLAPAPAVPSSMGLPCWSPRWRRWSRGECTTASESARSSSCPS